MDLLGQLLTGGLQAGTPSPTDDFWYQPVGTMTSSGIRIDPEGAKKISAWFRGREILATALAMLPLQVMQRLPDEGGAEPARAHALYDALHRKPNEAEDSFTWRRQKMYDLIDYGWTFDRVTIGQRWTFDRIDAQLVTPEKITRGPSKGKWLFHVRDEVTGLTETKTQDELFYLQSCGGKGILEYARESLGLARVTDSYAAKVFGSGSLNAGMIEVPGPMNDESARVLAQSFKTAAGDWHMPKVLPMGAKWNASDALTPDKAQMLLSRKFSITDIARWLGLPPHMLGDLERATFSNIEHQGQEFVTYSLGPWLSLFEFGINDQLILQPNRFYAEFVRDALVRGDIAARWQAYQIAVQTGTYTRNEVRRLENKPKLDGLDTPLEPAHLTGNGAARKAGAAPPAREDDDAEDEPRDDEQSARLLRAERIAARAAAKVLITEVSTVQKLAVQHASDMDAFAASVTEFYANHAGYVASVLLMPRRHAHEYCAGQAAQIVSGDWVAAVRQWETPEYAAGLAALALETAA